MLSISWYPGVGCLGIAQICAGGGLAWTLGRTLKRGWPNTGTGFLEKSCPSWSVLAVWLRPLSREQRWLVAAGPSQWSSLLWTSQQHGGLKHRAESSHSGRLVLCSASAHHHPQHPAALWAAEGFRKGLGGKHCCCCFLWGSWRFSSTREGQSKRCFASNLMRRWRKIDFPLWRWKNPLKAEHKMVKAAPH